MGKRQTRVFPSQLGLQADWLSGRKANVLLDNQTTFYGTILEVTDEHLHLRDMRLKKHRFPIKTITEVILDQVTEW